MIPFNAKLSRRPHGIFFDDECLLVCETREDAEAELRKSPAFKQLRSIGAKLEIRPVKEPGSKIFTPTV